MQSIVEVIVPAAQADAFAAGVNALLTACASTAASRSGHLTKVTILRGAHTDSVNHFLLIGDASGPVGMLHLLGDTPFAAFHAKVQDRGDFETVGEWAAKAG